jgi:hypothetical protein
MITSWLGHQSGVGQKFIFLNTADPSHLQYFFEQYAINSSPFLAIFTAHTMNCSSQPPHDVSVHPAFLEPVQKYPATCWEIVLALFSSLITGAYTLHHNENQVRHPFPFLPSQKLPLTTANNRSRVSVSRCLSSRFWASLQGL